MQVNTKKYGKILTIIMILLLVWTVSFFAFQSQAKKRLLGKYTLPPSSKCGVVARVQPSTFSLTPNIIGYNYKIENNDHQIVTGSITFFGKISEKSHDPLQCGIL